MAKDIIVRDETEARKISLADLGYVRIVDADGVRWFVVSDVSLILGGASGHSRYMTAKLGEEYKSWVTIETRGGPQRMHVINEAGLIQLICRARTKKARIVQEAMATGRLKLSVLTTSPQKQQLPPGKYEWGGTIYDRPLPQLPPDYKKPRPYFRPFKYEGGNPVFGRVRYPWGWDRLTAPQRSRVFSYLLEPPGGWTEDDRKYGPWVTFPINIVGKLEDYIINYEEEGTP